MKTNVRAAIATFCVLGCIMIPTPVLAGAVVYKDNYDSGLVCDPPGAFVVCFRQKGTWREVSTPSGNYTYSLTGTSFISVTSTDPVTSAVSSSQTTIDADEKMLFKAGVPHNGHSFTQQDFVSSVDGSCQTITVEYDYSFANGNVTQKNFYSSKNHC